MPRGRVQSLLDSIDIHLIYIMGFLLLFCLLLALVTDVVASAVFLFLFPQSIIWTHIGDLRRSGESFGTYLLANELLTLAFVMMLFAFWATG